MENLFLILNGDDVGEHLGNAIIEKDHNKLSSISKQLKEAHEMLDNWVTENGGKVIASSGDENFYEIPAELADKLPELMQMYYEKTALTLTGGIGADIEEASKAMIYGKMSGKDQVVHYEPVIDDYIRKEHLPTEEDVTQDKDQQNEQQEGVSNETQPKEVTNVAPNDDKSMVKIPVDEAVKEHERLVDTLKSPDHKDDLEEAKEQQQELDQYKDQQTENQQQEEGEEQQEEVPTHDYYDFPHADNPIIPQNDDEIPELSVDELSNPENHPDNDSTDQEENNAVEGMSQEQEQEGEDGGDLKQRVAEALMQFKENKEELERMKQENPELYQAQISMLRSMIEMAKKLKVTVDSENIEKSEPLVK